jgi:hypothetical protein
MDYLKLERRKEFASYVWWKYNIVSNLMTTRLEELRDLDLINSDVSGPMPIRYMG